MWWFCRLVFVVFQSASVFFCNLVSFQWIIEELMSMIMRRMRNEQGLKKRESQIMNILRRSDDSPLCMYSLGSIAQ